MSFCGGVGVDGVHGAEGVDQGGAGVHGHGYAEGFGDFFLGGAGFEGGFGVEVDATIAAGGDGYGDGDELTGFFAEEGVGFVGVGEGLVALERVGGEFGKAGDGFGEFGFVGGPIEHHGSSPVGSEDDRTLGVYDRGERLV